MINISSENIFSKLFKNHQKQVELVEKVYIEWGNQVFIGSTSRSDHWLYLSRDVARQALIDTIIEHECCPPALLIYDARYPQQIDYKTTKNLVSEWVDDLENMGIITYKTTKSL